MHLKEHGVAVYGFGDAKTPAPFQSACTRFLVLDQLELPDDGEDDPGDGGGEVGDASPGDGDAARPTAKKAKKTAKKTADTTATKKAAPPERATRAQLRGDGRLVALLRRAVASASDDSGWARIGTVGQRINNQSSFDSRNYGYAKLSKLIETSELFEVRGAGTADMAVRDPRAR
ncbi:OST-HTH/LOTUS domain-containing protein [Phycicoccus sp. BSK3Z-2]|uniref:OST-HTH/LOTUS domain-containing protein n=2 Tax=Phycicoccus avicenniae TaxID=2828860 RepID=A0A941HYM4_9MICO|nr:OST-HTH/LOTUS domain-containing protein [Phycicoccus avicenniae]